MALNFETSRIILDEKYYVTHDIFEYTFYYFEFGINFEKLKL